jgi:hypothetical protein
VKVGAKVILVLDVAAPVAVYARLSHYCRGVNRLGSIPLAWVAGSRHRRRAARLQWKETDTVCGQTAQRQRDEDRVCSIVYVGAAHDRFHGPVGVAGRCSCCVYLRRVRIVVVGDVY